MAEKIKTVKDKLKINYATKTQIDEATDLSETELYIVDPEYTGKKALATDENGNIIESITTDTELSRLSGVTANVQQQINAEIFRAEGEEARLDKKIDDETERATAAEEALGSDIGNLADLTTDDKNTVVAAINEVDSHADTNASNIGQLASLTTDAKNNLVAAVNEVDSHTDTNTSNIGTLTSLTTDAKNNLVSAINEVDAHTDTNTINIGALSSLTTDTKTTIVGAINEVDSHADTNASNIGTLSNLTTDSKTNLVVAINEVDANADLNATHIGTVTSLTTDEKTNLVDAINEVDSHADTNAGNITTLTNNIGTLSSLTTDAKNTIVAAINEVDSHTDTNTSNIGTLTSLTTDAKNTLVAAINEVDSHADTANSNIGTLTSLTTDAKNTLVAAINEVDSHTDTNTSDIADINALIPNEATEDNQLADKDFVNSSIATQTGNFIGTFPNIPARDAYTGEVTNNDYCFVINSVITNNGSDWPSIAALNNYDKTKVTNFDYAWVIDGSKFDLYRFDVVGQIWEKKAEDVTKEEITLNSAYNRYKAVVTTDTPPVLTWEFEYTLNNSSFTAEQWAAINSTATKTKIDQITTNKNAIGTLSSLTTDAKTNLVAAINELDSEKLAKNTAITGGTFTKVTVDSKGLVTSGTTMTLSDITDVTASAAEVNVLDGITASTSELNILDGVTATTTELNYVDGVTSNIQTQLNNKQPTITGAATTITSSNLTINRALISDASGKVAVSNITSTELGYLDDVTSNIQTQLNAKANDADISAVGKSNDYEDLDNKPTIGNATITFKANGSTIAGQSFTTNATTDVEIDLGNTGLVDDVQINSTSIVSNKVANIPYTSTTNFGAAKVDNTKGITATAGILETIPAADSDIVSKTDTYKVLTSAKVDKTVMEGLGNSNLTWTDAYKYNARNTIGATQVILKDWD